MIALTSTPCALVSVKSSTGLPSGIVPNGVALDAGVPRLADAGAERVQDTTTNGDEQQEAAGQGMIARSLPRICDVFPRV